MLDGRAQARSKRASIVLGGSFIFSTVLFTTLLLHQMSPPVEAETLPATENTADYPRQQPTLYSTAGSAALPYLAEIWAGGYDRSPASQQLMQEVRSLIPEKEVEELKQLCGRTLYHSLTHTVSAHGLADWTFVATGDIPDMWIRDSAVQMSIYFPRMRRHRALRRVLEGTAKTQAFFILQDPYANSFYCKWRAASSVPPSESAIGRGGWVASRNYELDSGAYFINFLYNYYASGVYSPETLLGDPLVFEAVSLMVETWEVEQRHEQRSLYRYSELPRQGLGAKTGYTGMSWSGFRPSDDANKFGYSIPSNIYAAGALQRVLAMNERIWRSRELADQATSLLRDIEAGIKTWGVVEIQPGVKIYAYEVDGLGGNLTDFDDANVPSLLSIPLLGWDGWDREIYAATRSRLLSPKYNKWYFKGSGIEGVGSPHTPNGSVWPLASMVQVLTSEGAAERAKVLRQLLKMQCGDGLMHESVSTDDPTSCTRPLFEWANAMSVVAVEAALGVDCAAEAEVHRLEDILAREKRAGRGKTAAGRARKESDLSGFGDALYFENLEALIAHEAPALAQRERQFS